MKRTIKALFIALALFGAVFAFSGSAKAANWDPGRIIDDGKFTNKNAMTPTDIQNFLNSKVPTASHGTHQAVARRANSHLGCV